MTSARRRSGYTLIELVLVILIIGLIVGVAATRLDFMIPKYQLRGAARDLAAVFRQGKARAAAQGKDVYFEMDLSKGQYWLLCPFPKLEAGENAREVEGKPVVFERVFQRSLPDGVQFTDVVLGVQDKVVSGTARLRLSALGASSHAIANLRNRDDREIAVRMNGFTGLVSFDDKHLEAGALLEDRAP